MPPLKRVHIEPNSDERAFEWDVRDFFAERRAGHLSRWLYSTAQFKGDPACGADAWMQAVEAAKRGSAYYVFLAERAVIRSAIPEVKSIFSAHTRVIDLGPGSRDAVQHKVLPFIRDNHASVTEYVAVDVSPTILDVAKDEIRLTQSQLNVRGLEHDFVKDNFVYGKNTQTEIAALFGLTLCNMAIDPRIPNLPDKLLTSYFKSLSMHFSAPQSYLMITQDINQDPKKLRDAYMALAYHFTRVLHLVKRDLNVMGDYDPRAFQMHVDFFPATEACALAFVPTRTMRFSIGDEAFRLQAGQKLYFHNAFKFNKDRFIAAAHQAGFDCTHTQRILGNSCLFHTFKKH